jgi:hypothetical protein
MLIPIHNSILYFEDSSEIYYKYIVNLITDFLQDNINININIIFSCNNHDYNFNNNNKTLRISLNYEHTLVKQNGRHSYGSPTGNIKDENNNNYLVRIDRFNFLNTCDIIIDYSIPNIHNVYTSKLFTDFSNKHINIFSSIYDLYFIKENRNIESLTTFIDINQPRRKLLLTNILNQNIPHININNVFGKCELQELYKNTKVIINIHQTDHHHTFEELRVLPALQCGVIVICEYSPLSELIPYNDYIIWTSYDSILDKTREVLNNYDYYHNLIFVNPKKISLDTLNNINCNTLNNKIVQLYN